MGKSGTVMRYFSEYNERKKEKKKKGQQKERRGLKYIKRL
jgi:hypothetical protein